MLAGFSDAERTQLADLLDRVRDNATAELARVEAGEDDSRE